MSTKKNSSYGLVSIIDENYGEDGGKFNYTSLDSQMDKNNGKNIFRIYNNDNCEIFIFRKGEEFATINTQKNIILQLPFNLSDIFTVNISWRDWYNNGIDSPFSWDGYPKNVDTDTFSQIIITHYSSDGTGENPCIIHIIGKI